MLEMSLECTRGRTKSLVDVDVGVVVIVFPVTICQLSAAVTSGVGLAGVKALLCTSVFVTSESRSWCNYLHLN